MTTEFQPLRSSKEESQPLCNSNEKFQTLCNSIASEVGRLLPEILKTPEDLAIGNGNCVLCMMNAAGDTVTKMYGSNPIRQRQVAQIATKKALQVWLTKKATGAFETLVYTHQVDEDKIGIPRPELIGWLGGLEAKTLTGERLILAFSGVRGEQDQDILRQAAASLGSFSIVD